MDSVYLTKEHKIFREHIRNFLEKEVMPYLDDWENKKKIPKDIWKKMGNLGLLGLHYPKTFGGSEKDIFYSVILLEELGRTGYTGFRVSVAVHAYMATAYLLHAGSNELKEFYLSPSILGDKIACLAITEPETGSDLNNLQTTATLDNDSYVINGVKKFVANGTIADFIVLAVRTVEASTEPKRGVSGILLIVVDTNSEGLYSKQLDNFNWYSSDTSEIKFTNVRVPKKNVIGGVNQGFSYIMKCLQFERLVAGILAIGGIDSCLDLTWQYISRRKAFNTTISKFQAIRHRMADIVTELEVVRQFAYHTAWMYEQGNLPIAECSMLKLKATELSNKAARECMQFHGAYGCENKNAISRIYRDFQATTIAGGTSEIMRDIIAQITFDETGWRRIRK